MEEKVEPKKTGVIAAEVAVKAGETTKSITIGLIAAVLAFIAVAYIIPTPEGLSREGHLLFAVIVAAIILWVSEALPIGITALAVPAALIAFGIQPRTPAWAGFATSSVMFVLCVIIFGVILNQVGLAKRLMLGIISVVGTNVKTLSIAICFACTFLASILHDATVAIIFCSALVPVFMSMGITPAKTTNLARFFMVLIPLSASVGGAGTMIGGGRNPVAVELLFEATGIHIGFFEYLIRNLPLIGFMAIGIWTTCWLIFRPEVKELPAAIATEKLPPMSWQEKGVLVSFATAFALWLTSDLHGIHLSSVAAFCLTPIFMFRLVDPKETFAQFPWQAWLVFGAGVTMGLAMLHTEAGAWLAMQFVPLFEGAPWPVVFWATSLFSSMLSSIMSNTAATALILPVTIPMAEGLGISPSAIAISSPIATGFVALVIGAPPMIIAYSFGYFSQVDFIKVGVPCAFVSMIVLTVLVALYWPIAGIEPGMKILGIW